MWPTAHPRIHLERGETLSFSLRVWTEDSARAPISVTTEHPGVIVQPGERRAKGDETASALPPNAVATAVRTESAGSGYWLDVRIGPVDQAGLFRAPLQIPEGFRALADAGQSIPDVTVVVVESSIAINPATIDLGTISIASLGVGPVQIGTVNVRKLFGSFRLVSVTSGVPALSFDIRTIIKDKNYLIGIRVDRSQGLSPGSLDCAIQITTDDPKHPRIEVPLKAVIAP